MSFMECDTCRSKPGTPPLCRGCLHNRFIIASLKLLLNSQYGKFSNVPRFAQEQSRDGDNQGVAT